MNYANAIQKYQQTLPASAAAPAAAPAAPTAPAVAAPQMSDRYTPKSDSAGPARIPGYGVGSAPQRPTEVSTGGGGAKLVPASTPQAPQVAGAPYADGRHSYGSITGQTAPDQYSASTKAAAQAAQLAQPEGGLVSYGSITGQAAPDQFTAIVNQRVADQAQVHEAKEPGQVSSYGTPAHTPVATPLPATQSLPLRGVANTVAPKQPDAPVNALSIDPMQAAAQKALMMSSGKSRGGNNQQGNMAPQDNTKSAMNVPSAAQANMAPGGGGGGSNADEGRFSNQMWNSNFANSLSNAGYSGQTA